MNQIQIPTQKRNNQRSSHVLRFKSAQTQYLHHLKLLLPYHYREEKQYIKRLEQNLSEYMDEFPASDYNDLVKQFGAPKEIAAQFYAELDDDQFMNRIRMKKCIRKLCFIALFAITILVAYRSIDLYRDYQEAEDSIPAYEEETITTYY